MPSVISWNLLEKDLRFLQRILGMSMSMLGPWFSVSLGIFLPIPKIPGTYNIYISKDDPISLLIGWEIGYFRDFDALFTIQSTL